MGREIEPKQGLRVKFKPLFLILSILCVIIIGVLDQHLRLDMSLFYLIPTMLSDWFIGAPYGICIAAISALTWLIADLLSGNAYSNSLVPVWNITMRSGFFLIILYLIEGLKEQMRQEKILSRTDSLTKVGNTRYFYECASNELERTKRYHHPIALAFIDVDDFKNINDTMGHSTGDKLLYLIGQTLKVTTRTTDIIGRLGGDEFAVIFLEVTPEKADLALQRVQKILIDTVNENKYPVTFSIGMVTFMKCPDSVDDMISMGDRLMYKAKASGKNRYIGAVL